MLLAFLLIFCAFGRENEVAVGGLDEKMWNFIKGEIEEWDKWKKAGSDIDSQDVVIKEIQGKLKKFERIASKCDNELKLLKEPADKAKQNQENKDQPKQDQPKQEQPKQEQPNQPPNQEQPKQNPTLESLVAGEESHIGTIKVDQISNELWDDVRGRIKNWKPWKDFLAKVQVVTDHVKALRDRSDNAENKIQQCEKDISSHKLQKKIDAIGGNTQSLETETQLGEPYHHHIPVRASLNGAGEANLWKFGFLLLFSFNLGMASMYCYLGKPETRIPLLP